MKKEDQDQDQVQVQVQVHFPLSTISYDHTSNLQNSQYDQQGGVHIEQLSQQINHQSNERSSIGGSSPVQLLFNSTELAVDSTREERTDAAALPAKWMSSKMRLMRKMMGEDRIVDIGKQGSRRAPQDQARHYSNPDQCSSSNSNGIIRVCSNCSTTKTPLWRSGPQGPKSLCNACGIRQMKARRAMRAAAAAAASAAASGGGGGGGGVLVPAATAPKKAAAKEERSLELVDRTVPFKKRFKNIATSSSTSSSSSAQKKKKKKLRFDDITSISLSKKLSFNQTSSTFPQEEKDAAILLMALSCGLIHG